MLGQFRKWYTGARRAGKKVYNKFISEPPTQPDMTIKLRPHQQSALDKMALAGRGTVLMPTGSGKTLVGIMDAVRRFNGSTTPISIIVVAPRLLLANQLCEEYMEVIKDEVSTQVVPAHIHSGDTSHFSTTKASEIRNFVSMTQAAGLHRIFFTTYHSLHRIAESSVQADYDLL